MVNDNMKIGKIGFEYDQIYILTKDERKASHTLKWFPRLENAPEKQRNHFELSLFGSHWPDIDEDLSYEGF